MPKRKISLNKIFRNFTFLFFQSSTRLDAFLDSDKLNLADKHTNQKKCTKCVFIAPSNAI